MSKRNQTVVHIDGVEVGCYRSGGSLVIYANQGSHCIFRKRIELQPGLWSESQAIERLGNRRRETGQGKRH